MIPEKEEPRQGENQLGGVPHVQSDLIRIFHTSDGKRLLTIFREKYDNAAKRALVKIKAAHILHQGLARTPRECRIPISSGWTTPASSKSRREQLPTPPYGNSDGEGVPVQNRTQTSNVKYILSNVTITNPCENTFAHRPARLGGYAIREGSGRCEKSTTFGERSPLSLPGSFHWPPQRTAG